MTAGEAMERTLLLRPGCAVRRETLQLWLREADAMLRRQLFEPDTGTQYADVGADVSWQQGLSDEAVLLVPAPYDALYPHYLCAQTDAALGENDRCALEQAQYNTLLSALAVWLRRTYCPQRTAQWRW